MTVQEEIQLQEYVNKHQASLGCAELKKRGRLVNQSTALLGRLMVRAKESHGTDHAYHRRCVAAFRKAVRRAERREKAYYGA